MNDTISYIYKFLFFKSVCNNKHTNAIEMMRYSL